MEILHKKGNGGELPPLQGGSAAICTADYSPIQRGVIYLAQPGTLDYIKLAHTVQEAMVVDRYPLYVDDQ